MFHREERLNEHDNDTWHPSARSSAFETHANWLALDRIQQNGGNSLDNESYSFCVLNALILMRHSHDLSAISSFVICENDTKTQTLTLQLLENLVVNEYE